MTKLFAYRLPERFARLADRQVRGTGVEPEAYLEESRQEWETIAPWVDRPRRVLELGCGLGRMSIFVNAQLADPEVHFILADTTEETERENKAGWNPGEDFYNDLALTAEFVRLNGLENFETFDIRRGSWAKIRDVDLVMSFLAVGFHFPIEDVLGELLEAATPHSTMIFGVRAGRYSPFSFREHFHDVRLLVSAHDSRNARCQHFLVLRRPRARAAGALARMGWRVLHVVWQQRRRLALVLGRWRAGPAGRRIRGSA